MRAAAIVITLLCLAACSADWVDPNAAPATGAAPMTEPAITIPEGVLAAVPFQNRLDVAQGIFQVKLYNGTAEMLDIVGVKLVWAGLTTPFSPRENRLVAGDRIDYPVSLAATTCVGDGAQADMPDPQSGIVEVSLRDGSIIDAPVFDVQHFARKLYLADCERQHIAASVGIELIDLHEADLDGRPITEGLLRLTRRGSTGIVTVHLISNTINFTFQTVSGAPDPVAVLPADQNVVEVPVRFAEGRCDAHALSESSQPFNFIALLDLGDGVERSFATVPPLEDQVPMRRRVEAGCAALGAIGFIGQDG